MSEPKDIGDQRFICSMLEWHERVFPDISPQEQLEKLEEEKQEFFASNYSIKEYVDVLIVAIILNYRFGIETGLAFAGQHWHNFKKSDINKEIRKKMRENVGRKWDIKANRHIG